MNGGAESPVEGIFDKVNPAAKTGDAFLAEVMSGFSKHPGFSKEDLLKIPDAASGIVNPSGGQARLHSFSRSKVACWWIYPGAISGGQSRGYGPAKRVRKSYFRKKTNLGGGCCLERFIRRGNPRREAPVNDA